MATRLAPMPRVIDWVAEIVEARDVLLRQVRDSADVEHWVGPGILCPCALWDGSISRMHLQGTSYGRIEFGSVQSGEGGELKLRQRLREDLMDILTGWCQADRRDGGKRPT